MVSLDGGLHAKSITSQRYRATYKMADMRYYGNVMTTTRWHLYVILHLQQYSRRLNLFYFLIQSNPNVLPPTLSAHESLRKGLP